MIKKAFWVVFTLLFSQLSPFILPVSAQATIVPSNQIQIQQGNGAGALGFNIPTLGDVLTFLIRAFFVIGGLMALLYLLLGAFAWITSGGNKENVDKAREKITNAVIGVILIAVVLAVIVTLEQVVFGSKICFGLSCPITIPSLVK